MRTFIKRLIIVCLSLIIIAILLQNVIALIFGAPEYTLPAQVYRFIFPSKEMVTMEKILDDFSLGKPYHLSRNDIGCSNNLYNQQTYNRSISADYQDFNVLNTIEHKAPEDGWKLVDTQPADEILPYSERYTKTINNMQYELFIEKTGKTDLPNPNSIDLLISAKYHGTCN